MERSSGQAIANYHILGIKGAALCGTANCPPEMSQWVINCRANSQEARLPYL
jgi:hypothetical protein